MRSRPSPFALFAAALLLVAAAPPVANPLALREGSRLWFDGTSTLRSWSCSADRIDAAIDGEAGTVGAVLEGRTVAGTVQLDFPVSGLECRNGTMNDHMRKALKAGQHKGIRFTLDRYELAKAATVTGTLHGALTIAGQTRPITVPVTYGAAGDGLRVTGAYTVKMTDWGVEPPRLMMGTLKVGADVVVRFDLVLQP